MPITEMVFKKIAYAAHHKATIAIRLIMTGGSKVSIAYC